MVSAKLAVDSVVACLQSIPQLVAELGGPQFITGHYYLSGVENSLTRALSQMSAPSMLVAYQMRSMGNFDGMTLWKHTMQLYIRARNAGTDGITGHNSASLYGLSELATNYPVSVPYAATNIHYVDLANGNLWLSEYSDPHYVDELGQDYLACPMIFREMGDVGPDGVTFLCIGPETAQEGQHGFAHTK